MMSSPGFPFTKGLTSAGLSTGLAEAEKSEAGLRMNGKPTLRVKYTSWDGGLGLIAVIGGVRV